MTLLALVGPTASGKTEAGIALAERLAAEIVSVDSMLVYRRMDVGTAKPTTAQRARVPHHLLDVAEPGETFSVARFQELARAAVDDIERRGRRPLLVGGSGLYFRAVVDGLDFPGTDPEVRRELETEAVAVGARPLHDRLRSFDPAAAGKIEPANVRRTVRALEVAAVTGRPFSSYAEAWEEFPAGRVRAAGIGMDPAVLRERIEGRIRHMVAAGFVEEVRALVADGLGPSLTASQAIGYAEMVHHLAGRISLEDAVASTVKRTRALARRQMAWFRRDPRIRWFPVGPEGAKAVVDDLLEHYGDG
ncbi:MAG: tRNA (adenosine(37)-N6)-dimethylallyltransferase MiaA [Actinomycetota bacterium]|nr:tRNA (adenosine(37)-N6)-dimethylallyltransferase MiaA [Actinomycetota bacterium]